MTIQTEIDHIDQAIDANRRALLARIKFAPSNAREYQAAWNRNPVLWTIEQGLFHQRGNAQAQRDQEIEKYFQIEQRRARAKRRAT